MKPMLHVIVYCNKPLCIMHDEFYTVSGFGCVPKHEISLLQYVLIKITSKSLMSLR